MLREGRKDRVVKACGTNKVKWLVNTLHKLIASTVEECCQMSSREECSYLDSIHLYRVQRVHQTLFKSSMVCLNYYLVFRQ